MPFVPFVPFSPLRTGIDFVLADLGCAFGFAVEVLLVVVALTVFFFFFKAFFLSILVRALLALKDRGQREQYSDH